MSSLRSRMRQALTEAMRARDRAEAAPVEEAELRSVALELSPAGAGATEAARHELSESGVAEIVHGEVTERLEAAARLTASAHTERAARLRAEAAALSRLLDEPGTS